MSIDSKYLLLEEIEINELVTMLNSLPDASLLTSYIASSECVEMFANWKRLNLQVIERLNAYFSGTDPIGTTDAHDFVAALSMFELAQYSLIFESWHRLKPLAVTQGLIQADCKPRDYLRLIKNQEYDKVLTEIKRKSKRISNRTLYGRALKSFKFNDKSFNNSISALAINASNEKTRADYLPLLMLLLDVVAKYRKSDTSINTANLNYGNALQGALKEARLLAHHKNKTR
jgi:hypothetical protein